ncbi:MAG: hypothetical protein R3E90_12200 [Marinicella sp.]
MKIKLFVCAVFTMNLMASTLMAAEARFFRHLKFRETPFSSYQGIHPINQQQAQTTAHYRFEYDDQQRITLIAYMLGDQIINDNGNWDTFIWFAPKVTISYQPNQETHQYFNAGNQRISAHGAVYTATYQLDKQGKRHSLAFTNENNEASENAWGIHRYQWQHVNQQELIEKRFSLDGNQQPIRPEFKFFETHMTFDDLGQLQLMKNFGLDGKPTNNDSGAGMDRIFYDFAGNFQRWHVFDKDGHPVEGNRPMVHIGEHLYDEFGNKIGLRGFDKQSLPKTFSWGEFLIKRSFDASGNQTASLVYDENMQLVSNIKIEYSSDGLKRTWLKSFDTSGKLTSSANLGGAAAINYKYEADSLTPNKIIRLDEQLNPINPS